MLFITDMRIYGVNSCLPAFRGQRQDRKAVNQLSEDNQYDLNIPNQRRITTAINNLSEVSGEDNISFLINVSQNLKYGTNIQSDKKAYHDWQGLLLDAARKSVSLSDKNIQDKYTPIIDGLAKKGHDLTAEEREILENKNYILSRIDTNELSNIKNSNIRNLKRNLEYFIISSEVPLSQKAYIMDRLAYFMSDKYEINSQLEGKKTQAIAEIINDIVVDTPESVIPNTKAVNQCSHGICAAISICRKALAYEDKANFVDLILSELDNKDYMMVYDINKLGSHTKIPIEKTYIDFKYALEKGYRIIDTSSMYWMHIADHAGAANERIGHYSAFDKKNYDTFTDTHISADIDDEAYALMNDYYRSLINAKNDIAAVKKQMALAEYKSKEKQNKSKENLSLISHEHAYLRELITKIAPFATEEQVNAIAKDILTLEVDNLEKAQEINTYTKNYVYMPKEDSETKINKINSFLKMALKGKLDDEILSKNIENILDVVDKLNELNAGAKSSYAGRTISEASKLYAAAAAYRTQTDFSLDIPENLYSYMLELNIPDNETILVQNMENLIQKAKAGKLNPKIREQLAENFNTDNTNEALIKALEGNLDAIKTIITGGFDEIYYSSMAIDRKNVLATRIADTKDEIIKSSDKKYIEQLAAELGVKSDKNDIIDKLNKYQAILENDKFTEEDYVKIYNKMGYKSQLSDLKTVVDNFGSMVFSDSAQGNVLRSAFYQLNGLDPNASIEDGVKLYNSIAKKFNDIASLLTAMHTALYVEDENGIILNSADPKNIVLKKLENNGEIPTLAELNAFRDRFSKIDNIMNSFSEGRIFYKDLPKEYTTLTPLEESALKKYKKNINDWYALVKRDLDDAYHQLAEPLNELHRIDGIRTGRKYLEENRQGGLNLRDQIRIIEHMTDRPYYADNDMLRSVGIIKSSPYSGIGNEHISANEYSSHAQYIADVSPVAKRDKDDKILYKDAIFYDNTWGAYEHSSNWYDKDGNLRTDYDGDYGVDNRGFIVNSKYQEGVFVDELKDAIGKIIPSNIPSKAYKKFDDSENYIEKYSLFQDIITAGIDPAVNSAVRSIRDQLLYSPYQYLNDLEDLARGMTKDEIKKAILTARTAGMSVYNEYEKIERIVNGDGILNKGINTLDEYNSLPDNSLVKTLFEKAAAILSYGNMPADGKMLYKEFNVSDLKAFKDQIHSEARKDFDYTFAKDLKFYVYAVESVREKVYDILSVAARENNINIPKDVMVKAVNSMKDISNQDFDGSLEHTADIMVSNFKNYIAENTQNFDNKEKYIDTMGNIIFNNIISNCSLSINELNNFSSGNLQNIGNWIDNVFSPATDEEFVNIFNDLRNMTKADFENKYNSLITDDVIGIKNITGYDILKDFKNEIESIQNVVFNTMYYQQYAKEVELSKLKAFYDYGKFSRTSRGAVYVGKRTFNDIYSDYYTSLLMLSRMKENEKLSGELFKRYGLFFAYPKVEVSDAESIAASLNALKENINDYIIYVEAYKTQKISFELCQSLKKRIDRYKSLTNVVNPRQRAYLLKDLQKLAVLNKDDETVADLLSEINNVLEEKPASIVEYENLINELNDRFILYTHTVDGSTMDEAIASSLKNINVYKKTFINGIFTEKYQSKGMLLLNKWIDAKMKSVSDPSSKMRDEQAELAFEKFKDFYMKHRVFQKPEEVLNEFLLLNAKDAAPSFNVSNDVTPEELALRCKNLKDTINIHKENLKGLLYKASLLELQSIIMECAKSSNLNVVGKNLINSNLKLKDGSYLQLGSDEGLQAIISPLLAENSLDSAALFFNQLGLSERIAEMITSGDIFNKAYKNINRIDRILKSVNSQAKYINDTLAGMSNIDNVENYEEMIIKYQDSLLQKIKKTNYRRVAEIYNAAIDDTLEEIKKQPNSSRYLILKANMTEALAGVRAVVTADINNLNEEIRIIQNTGRLLSKLELPETGKAYSLRENFYSESVKLADYQNSLPDEYSDIGLSRV